MTRICVIALLVSLLFAFSRGVQAQMDVALVNIHSTTVRSALHSSIELSAPITQKLHMLNSFLLVEAEIDGTLGLFVLDSGAPGLILNRPSSSIDPAEDLYAEGVSGRVAVGTEHIKEFAWGPLHMQSFEAYSVDLNYLTATLGKRVAGVIGYDQLRRLPFTLDFVAQRVNFHPTGYSADRPQLTFRMNMRGHLPTVRSRIDGRRLRLAIDTGAGVNLLDDKQLRKLNTRAHKPLEEMMLRGLNAEYTRVPRSMVHLTEIEDANWIGLPFAFLDLQSVSDEGASFQGVLGREWLQSHIVTFDYQQRRLYVQ